MARARIDDTPASQMEAEAMLEFLKGDLRQRVSRERKAEIRSEIENHQRMIAWMVRGAA